MFAIEPPCFDRSVMISYTVNAERCIRCGSCAIFAPGVFAVERRVQLVRQPEGDPELARCHAAAIACPTGAIRTAEHA
jgi:ferredoxin